MFSYLRSDMIRGNGLGRDVLANAEALEPEVIELFVVLEAHVNEVRASIQKQG